MKEPIRILHVLQRMEPAGIQTFLMSIYRKIDRSKVQFDFLVHYTEKQAFDDEIETLGGRIYRFSVREDYNFPKYYQELKEFFANHKEYKIVHGHMYALGFLYFGVAKKANIPVRICHAHTDQHYKSIKGYVSYILQKLYPLNATDYFACSKAAGKYFFGNKDFKVIKNVINTDDFIFDEKIREAKRAELGIENEFVVGHAARFAEHKNHKFLINVFNEIIKMNPNSKLILAGDGELRHEIEQMVKRLGIADKVLFLGVRSDINELYQAMDVFVFPSTFEGLGIVNIEAQASGLLTFCSSVVPEDANICPNFKSLDLNLGAKKWAEIIIDTYMKRGPREDMSSYVINAGYDAEDLAKKMEETYLSMYIS